MVFVISWRTLPALMSPPHNHLYEFEGFVLDPESRIVLRDGAVVRLTPKAFDTLLVLVERPSQLITKEQLLKEVWPDTYVEEGNLSRNIHELRKALGDDSSESRYIETIPKRGYRFVAPVKVSVSPIARADDASVPADATVIEKHTFARVISEESEEGELSSHRVESTVAALATPLVSAKASRGKTAKQLALICGVLFVPAIVAGLIYLQFLKRDPVAPSSRAKSTLVRLTNNNASDSLPVWSSDGRKIAFASNRDGKNEIYVMDADGSNVNRLTNNMADDDAPKWSRDGSKIVFDSDRDGNREIYVMDADGRNQTRLTTNDAIDSGAAWSPDSSKIAFASNRDNANQFNFDIYVMNADGSDPKKIVSDEEYDAEPRWSPDGSKILFVTGRNGNFDIYVRSSDGTEERNLTADNTRNDRHAVWSPDGSNIAFVSSRDDNNEIYLMDSDGTNLMRVTSHSGNDTWPSWSPDGSKLAFQTDRDGNWEICVTSVEGELVQLTDAPAEDLDPAWSPDGTKIAFSSNRAGKQHIYVMSADGSSLKQVTRSAGPDVQPSWSRDGKRIAFTSARDGNPEIYLINPDGTNEIRLTVNDANDGDPKWSAEGRILFTRDADIYAMDVNGSNVVRLTNTRASQPDPSPDGDKILFSSYASGITPQIFIADSNGSNSRLFANLSQPAAEPSWSPEGTTIVFVKVVDKMAARANVFQLNADGTGLKRLTAGPIGDQRPSVSPDGSKLAFQSNRSGNYEIYLKSLR